MVANAFGGQLSRDIVGIERYFVRLSQNSRIVNLISNLFLQLTQSVHRTKNLLLPIARVYAVRGLLGS